MYNKIWAQKMRGKKNIKYNGDNSIERSIGMNALSILDGLIQKYNHHKARTSNSYSIPIKETFQILYFLKLVPRSLTPISNFLIYSFIYYYLFIIIIIIIILYNNPTKSVQLSRSGNRRLPVTHGNRRPAKVEL